MTVNNSSLVKTPTFRLFLPIAFILALLSGAPLAVSAQTADDSAKADTAAEVQSRIQRARALAAAHQLTAAATELESLRTTAADSVVRNVTSVMLMNIYLEEGTYARAEALLEETFRSRATQRDGSISIYFVLAGQAVNGARAHLARYKTFGLSVTNADLPVEAVNDLERLRSLLERMIAQAKDISRNDSKGYDSLALLEDVLGIRLSLARDTDDREKWKSEYAFARQGLASSQRQVAALGGLPPQSSAKSSTAAGRLSSSNTLAKAPVESGAGKPSGGQSGSQTAAQPTSDGSRASIGGPDESAGLSQDGAELTTLTQGLLNPRATRKVAPSYPEAAKAAGIEGLVKVYVSISESGKVTGIFKSEGPDLLKKPSEAAARQWKFPPILVEGKPARLTGYIEFKFPQPVSAKP